LAYRGIPLQSAYCGAKHAVQGFTDSLRTELLAEKSAVRVCEVHLPALNTPQFTWVKSRLANKAQPVPPIYQPELAAEIIYKAAHGKRREWLLGWPTYLAIWGDKVAPGLADRYLAGKGFQVQQTDEPEDPARQDNLWMPPPGDFGSHGRFDARSRAKSPLFLISRYREGIILVLVAMAAAIGWFCKVRFGRARGRAAT
jgi:hypothetical protein